MEFSKSIFAVIWIIQMIGIRSTAYSLAPEGFDAPIIKHEFVLDNPRNKNQHFMRTCRVFPNFIVYDTDSMGEQMDAIEISVVKRDGHDKIECDKDAAGVIIPGDVFWGVVDRYLFVATADSFGGYYGFDIFEATSGKHLFRGTTNSAKEFIIKRSEGKIVLNYWHLLDSDLCNPKLNPPCWEKIVKKKKVMPSYPKPVCGPEDIYFQFGVPIELRNFENPAITYLWGQPTCSPAP